MSDVVCIQQIFCIPQNIFFLGIGLALSGLTILSVYKDIPDQLFNKRMTLYRGILGVVAVVISSDVLRPHYPTALIGIYFAPMTVFGGLLLYDIIKETSISKLYLLFVPAIFSAIAIALLLSALFIEQTYFLEGIVSLIVTAFLGIVTFALLASYKVERSKLKGKER